jgi:glycosyltransferase involved in cell wall biosynthesis
MVMTPFKNEKSYKGLEQGGTRTSRQRRKTSISHRRFPSFPIKEIAGYIQRLPRSICLLLETLVIYRSGFFNKHYYLESDRISLLKGLCAARHYSSTGWKEGRDPGPRFSTRFYLQHYPDVAASGVNPLFHYIRHGKQEGRQCSENAEYYKRIEKSGLFSRSYYLATNPDVATTGEDPLNHFLEYGWREGRNPSPDFNIQKYIQDNPELKEEGINPLIHALNKTDFPNLFSVGYSALEEQVNRRFTGDNAVLNVSPAEGKNIIKESGFFNEAYYLEKNRDVREAGVDALNHYYTSGWKEHRNPSPRFNTYGYLSTYPDAAGTGINPLLYFLLKGRHESHDPCAELKIPEVTDKEAEFLKEKLSDCTTLFSVIMPTYNRAAVICNAVDSVLRQSYPHFELIISDDGSTDGTVSMLSDKYAPQIQQGKIRLVENDHAGVSTARNAGLRDARGEWFAYLDSDNIWHPHYLLFVADAFVSNPYRKNCFAYLEVKDLVGDRHFLCTQEFSLAGIRTENYLDLNIYAHHRSLYELFGGFDESLSRLVDWDMIIRHAACYRPLQIKHVLGVYNLAGSLKNISSCVDHRPNREHIFSSMEANRDRLVAIKISAPDLGEAPEWGDYYLALALQRELIALGYMVRIDTRDDWYNPECEKDRFVITLRGISDYIPDKSAINIVWLISHPGRVTLQEMRKYDLILVASQRYAEQLSSLDNMPPVQVMEQFTDQQVFYPSTEDSDSTVDLLFVGNSRKIPRRIVKDCIDLGYDVAVYGTLWEDLIDVRYIKGQHIRNNQLHQYYSSAKIVLNDHWQDMVEKGFVSNRIFDVGASGSFVLSDKNPAIEQLFADAVVTYENKKDLKEKIDFYLIHNSERREKAGRLQSIVMQSHTAGIRGKFLHEQMQKLQKIRQLS